MKTIKIILCCAAASLASSAFAGWEGWGFYNDGPEAVNVAFGVDATINPYHDPENVGVSVFVTAEPYEQVYCPPLAIAQVNAEYSWLGIDDTVINNIIPYSF